MGKNMFSESAGEHLVYPLGQPARAGCPYFQLLSYTNRLSYLPGTAGLDLESNSSKPVLCSTYRLSDQKNALNAFGRWIVRIRTCISPDPRFRSNSTSWEFPFCLRYGNWQSPRDAYCEHWRTSTIYYLSHQVWSGILSAIKSTSLVPFHDDFDIAG